MTIDSTPEQDNLARPRIDRLWISGLLVLAVVPRIAHLLTVRRSPFFSVLILDPLMYDEWGWALARGEQWVDGVFFQDPLYAYFLAGIYAVLGHHYLPVVAIQLLLGATVPVLLYLAARDHLGRATAGVSGLIAALYPPAIYYEALILKTTLSTFLVALWLFLVAGVVGKRSRVRWLLCGVVLGLACLTRGNLLLMVPVTALWVVLDASDRRRWASAGLLILGCALVLLPTTVRNRVVGGAWVLTTANAGQNFYIGNNPMNETGEYQRLPFVDPNPKYEQRDFAAEASRRVGRPLGPVEISDYWFATSRTWIAEHPGAWLRLIWLKLRVYWGAYEVPDNLDYYLYRERAPVLRLALPGFGLLAPLGLLGAGLAWRFRGWPRLLVLLVVVYSASVILFFVFSRFRMAMVPAMYVLAAHAAVETWRSVRGSLQERRLRARTAALITAFLLLFAFVNLPVRGRADSLSLTLSRAVGLPVRIESSSMGHFNLGVAYAARARDSDDPARWLDQAERELRTALESEIRFASIPIELGKVLARQGRNAEAVELYRSALELEPANYRTHHALGLLYRRLHEDDPARAAFTRALQLEPRSSASAVELGEILLRLGRASEAEAAFRHALGLAPGSERARSGLERALAGVDP
jgi:4-amino-4-deoxy-L-arabinose transferase-like glycosyltransferase